MTDIGHNGWDLFISILASSLVSTLTGADVHRGLCVAFSGFVGCRD